MFSEDDDDDGDDDDGDDDVIKKIFSLKTQETREFNKQKVGRQLKT